MTKKNGIIITVVFVLIINAVWLIQNHKNETQEQKGDLISQLNFQNKPNNSQHTKSTIQSSEQLKLSRQIKKLQQQVHQFNVQTEQFENKFIDIENNNLDQSYEKENNKISAEELTAAEHAWTENYSSQLDDELQSIDGDLAWTSDIKSNTLEIIGDLPIGSMLSKTSCSSSICRIEIIHNDSQSHEILAENILSSIQWDGSLILIPINEGDQERTLIYLTQEGSELPAPETDIQNYVDNS